MAEARRARHNDDDADDAAGTPRRIKHLVDKDMGRTLTISVPCLVVQTDDFD